VGPGNPRVYNAGRKSICFKFEIILICVKIVVECLIIFKRGVLFLMFKIVSVLILSMLVGVLIGCIAQAPDNTVLGDVDKAYSVGERAEYGFLAITVRGVRTDFTEDNQKVLIIDCLIENSGARELALSVPVMFSLFDQHYYAMQQEFLADTKGNLNVVVGAGRKVAGEIAYVINPNDTEWELLFSPRSIGFNEVVFRITQENNLLK